MDEWWPANDPAGRSVREFRLARAGSDRPVTGALWSGDARQTSVPLILFGHGASGDRYQVPICQLAARFVRLGCHALSIDGPVHGLRQVGPGGRQALGDEMRRETFIDDMVDDWIAALAAVREQVNVGELGYFGSLLSHKVGEKLRPERSLRYDWSCEIQSETRMFRPWPTITRFSRSFSSWCRGMSSSPSRTGTTRGAGCAA